MLYVPAGEMTEAEQVCYDAGWLTPLQATTLKDQVAALQEEIDLLRARAPRAFILASAADFDTSRPAGFEIYEAQRSRCADRLPFAVLDQMCHPDIGKSLSRYHASQLLQDMTKLGYRIQYVEVPASEPAKPDDNAERSNG